MDIHSCNLDRRKQQVSSWLLPKVVQKELLQFLADMEIGKVNRGRRISERRQLKCLETLRIPLQFFNKPTSTLTLKNIEAFERVLTSGQLGSKLTNRPYAHSTQTDIRKVLKMFLRWRLGQAKALELAGWLDTRDRPKTPDFLKEVEIDRLYKYCRSAEQRFFVAMLFDSGARAEEFHNIRFEDIYLPEGKENFVKLALKEEYSKTLGRTISLYWKHSAEAVKEFLAQRVAEGIKPQEPVYHRSYAASRKFLQRLGAKVLKRSIHYHLFRHSSATYYATRLNRQELCYRYGWKFSSNMPDIYISRAGMETKSLDEKFTQTELGTLKDALAKLDQTARIKDDRIKQLEQAMQTMQANLEAVAKVIRKNPSIEEVEAALNRKRITSEKT